MNKTQITGIILCGGQSKRMGQNKTLLKLGEKPIIEHIISILEIVCSEIIISSNSQDLEYLPHKKVQDKMHNIGPIAGIFTALSESKTQHNLIVSCDTPFISNELLKYLIAQSPGFEIVLPYLSGQAQSLIGYFNKSIVQCISDEINNAHYKPIQIFESLNLKKVQIIKDLHFYNEYLFYNINSIEEYQQACIIYNRISS